MASLPSMRFIAKPKERSFLTVRETFVIIKILQESELVLVELNDEDLDLVSAGLAVTFPANTNFGVATGTGGNVRVAANGDITANAGTGGFALGIHTTAPLTVTF